MFLVYRVTLFIGAWGGVDFGLRFTRCEFSPAYERKFGTQVGCFVAFAVQHARAIQTNRLEPGRQYSGVIWKQVLRIRLRKVRTGCAMVTACVALVASVAHAGSVDADGGPLANAPVPRIALDDDHYLPSARLSEQVIGIPSGADGSITLQTTIFKPEGPGPFPMVVFNHGKMHGDPRMQSRSDPVSFAREFVRRGYVVVAPNRQGFAQSGGTYVQDGCDVERKFAELDLSTVAPRNRTRGQRRREQRQPCQHKPPLTAMTCRVT